ncbi:cwf29 [Malassezia furfur]|nr:cwf29 [Malassezia furfur]
MYEDQRSTILAVDNLNGAQVLGRTLRVDHVLNYKPERVPDADGNLVEPDEQTFNYDAAADDDEIDLSDPMAAYLAEEKKRKRHECHEHHRRRKERRGDERRSERRDDERHSERRDDERHRTRRGETDRERHERHKRERRERHGRSERSASPVRAPTAERRASAARQDTPPAAPRHSPVRAHADGDVTPPYRRGERTDTP